MRPLRPRQLARMKGSLIGTEVPNSDSNSAKYLFRRYLSIIERASADRVRVEIEREVERLVEASAAGSETLSTALIMISHAKGGKRSGQVLQKWIRSGVPNIDASACLSVLYHTTGRVTQHVQSQNKNIISKSSSKNHFVTALHLARGTGIQKGITRYNMIIKQGYIPSRSDKYSLIRCCRNATEVESALAILNISMPLCENSDTQVLLSVAQCVSYDKVKRLFRFFLKQKKTDEFDIIPETPFEMLVEKYSDKQHASRPDFDLTLKWSSVLLSSLYKEDPTNWELLQEHYASFITCASQTCKDSETGEGVTRSLNYLLGHSYCHVLMLMAGLRKVDSLNSTDSIDKSAIKSVVKYCEKVFQSAMADARSWIIMFKIYKASGMRKRSLVLGRYRMTRGRPSQEVLSAYVDATRGVPRREVPISPAIRGVFPKTAMSKILTPPGNVTKPFLPWKAGERPTEIPHAAKKEIQKQQTWQRKLRRHRLLFDHSSDLNKNRANHL